VSPDGKLLFVFPSPDTGNIFQDDRSNVYCKFRARTRVSSADCFSSECNTKGMFVVPSPSYAIGGVIWGLLCLRFGLFVLFVVLFCVLFCVVWGGGVRGKIFF
jgi:hypothetical protein